jgi:thiol-disulfide isomerase/thioredoxin
MIVSISAFGCGQSSSEAPVAAAAAAPIAPLAPGEIFPAGTYRNLNPDPGGEIDLAPVIGSRPVILYYWVPGNARSEEIFRELEALALEVGEEQLALYGIAVPRPNASAQAIAGRIGAQGFRAPVIEDLDFEIGKRLQVQSVPYIAVLDRQGRLQLSNGASLKQVIAPGFTLEAAIRNVSESGELSAYGTLGRYFPVVELEGSPCPDFRAAELQTSVEQTWSRMMDDEKLNVLIFWSVDCPHCRHALPEINTWLRTNADGLNVVSAAKIPNEAIKVKTREFCNVNDFIFPTLVDDSNLTDLFHVTSTPTIVFIRPDGVVDSASVSAADGFAAVIERKKREFLGS